MRFRKKEFEAFIDQLISKDQDITKRMISSEYSELCILYIKQVTDLIMLSQSIIKPLMEYNAKNKTALNADDIVNKVITVFDCHTEVDTAMIVKLVLSGTTIILINNSTEYVVASIRNVDKRAIEEPKLTYTLRGASDCFNENLDTNLSLVRYRIKDKNLKVEMHSVGARTETRIALLYIQDIANDLYVQNLKDRMSRISIEGIVESGQLQRLLEDRLSVFPQFGLVERSDMACHGLFEGKILILVEGSGIALICPKNFNEFLTSCDDMYDNVYLGAFMKLARLFAFFLSFSLTPLYVAIVSFHSDFLSGDYIITLASTRAGVPFSGFFEALVIGGVIDILRESLLRIPKQIGSAIGIVGAIVIGQAAISAGLFSATLLILVSLELIASFVPPDYTITNPIRVFKFLLLFLSGTFGLVGYTLGVHVIGVILVSHKSLGMPFMTPYAPLHLPEFIRSFLNTDVISRKRPDFMKTKDNTKK